MAACLNSDGSEIETRCHPALPGMLENPIVIGVRYAFAILNPDSLRIERQDSTGKLHGLFESLVMNGMVNWNVEILWDPFDYIRHRVTSTPTSTFQRGDLSCGLRRQCAKRHNDLALSTAEPCPTKIVAHARQSDSAVWAATAFFELAMSNHFDKKDVT